jgi:hypothetical protein
MLALTVASALLAWGADVLAVQARRDPRLPVAVRIAAVRMQAGVRSGAPLALAWGFGAGPLAGTAAGLTAGVAAAYVPRLSEVLIDRARNAPGGVGGLLVLGSLLVFFIAPAAGALVGGVTTGVRGYRSRGQRWGLKGGGFTIGFAGGVALTLSWHLSGGGRTNPVGDAMGSLLVAGLVGVAGGLAGAGGVRLGQLVRRGKTGDR